MKNLPNFALIFIINAVLIGNVNAQERTPKTPEERATALTEWMKTNLQLTADQEAPVKAINLKYANLNEQVKTSTNARMQKAKPVKDNDEKRDKELEGVLTKEQYKTYLAKKEEMKAKFNEEAQARKSR